MSQTRSFQSHGENPNGWLEGGRADAVSGVPVGEGWGQIAPVEQIDFPTSVRPVDQPVRQALLADYYRTVSLPVRTRPASFLAALHSTMSPSNQREPVIIRGSRRRISAARSLSGSKPGLHPHLRLGVVLTAITVVLFFTTISLSPVGDGQVNVPIVGGFIQWARDEQMKMDLVARHNEAPGQGAGDTTTMGPALPRSEYVAIAQADAQKYGISPVYFVNQIQQESHFNPYAQSGAGAVGIAQFEPTTAASLGINPYDPNSALDGAARYMATLQGQFGGDYAKALAAYNGGSGAVQAAMRNCGAAWLSCMSPQTQSYVNLIMR